MPKEQEQQLRPQGVDGPVTRSGEASAHLLLADVDESATLGSAEAGSPPPRPAFERAYDEIEQRVDRLVGAVEAS